MSTTQTYFDALRLPIIGCSAPILCLAAGLAYLDQGRIDPWVLGAVISGVACLHLAINLLAQWNRCDPDGRVRPFAWDRCGLDSGPPSGSLPRWSILVVGLIFLVLAFGSSLVLSLIGRAWAPLFGLGGLILGLAYVLIPENWRRAGLGDLFVMLAFGPVLTGAGYWTLTGAFSWTAALLGLPAGLLMASVIFGERRVLSLAGVGWATSRKAAPESDPEDEADRQAEELLSGLGDQERSVKSMDPRKEADPESETGVDEDEPPGEEISLVGPEPSWRVWLALPAALGCLVWLALGFDPGWLLLLGLAVLPLVWAALWNLVRSGSDPVLAGRFQIRLVQAHLGMTLLLTLGLTGERLLRG